MDNEHRGRTSGLGDADSLLVQLKKGAIQFADFEAAFIDTMTADFDRAGRIVERLKRTRFQDPLQEAHKQRLIGWFQERRSNHKLAIRWARRALASFEEFGESTGMHQCQRVLFSSYAHLGRYQKARFYADQALADPALSRLERVKIRTNLGSLAYRVHDYALARSHYARALELLAENQNPHTQALLLYNLGVLSICLNLFPEARENLIRANGLFEASGQGFYHAHTQQSLGYLYTILGQYFLASNRLKDAQEIYRELGDDTGAALCDIELLRLDMRLNRFDEVLSRVPDLVAAFEEKERYAEIGLIYYQGIRAALACGEYGLVREFLEQAQAVAEHENDAFLVATCTLIDGVLLYKRDCREEGLERILEAGRSFGDAALHERQLECLIYADKVGAILDDEPTFSLVRRLLKTPLSPPVSIQGLVMLHRFWHRRGQTGRAIRCLFEAVNLIEESRASISTGSLRASFFIDKAEIYELLLERLLEWNDPSMVSHIFRIMELSRGREMMERISNQENLPSQLNQNEPLVIALHHQQSRLNQLNRKLEHLATDTHVSGQERKALQESIRLTRAELDALRRKMRNEERLGLFFPIELQPKDIMSLLEPGRMLVLHFWGRQTLYRIEVTRTSTKTYQHPLSSDILGDFKRLMNILSYRIEPQMNQVDVLAERLSKILVPQGLKGIEHITFIFHKSLQEFPVALLRKNGRLLLEDYLLSQCPNLAVFYFTRKRQESHFERPVFLFSEEPEDPRAPERELLLNRFPNAKVIDNLAHSKLPEALEGSGFIHFAGHCVFDRDNPTGSFLQLGGERLSLRSFSQFTLSNNPFLNLAACQSGWTVVSAGNEPQGFVIGAFAAGASTLLASLWEIDDRATGAWMEQFYRYLHMGVARAYQHACLHLKHCEKSPYFWAGFCLLGRA